jgi:formate transporter
MTNDNQSPTPPASKEFGGIDPLLPPAMALKCEAAGADKAARDALSLFTLAILAGAFIAFGALFSTVAVAGFGNDLPFGVVRLLAGVTFSLGLILVVIGGAELFTGDNLMVMAWAGRRIGLGALLRVWAIVYAGNLVGSVATAALVVGSGQHELGGGAVGLAALSIAQAKAELGWVEALLRGVLCNVLVCLAVWLTFSARTVTGKVMVIVPPVAAFVAAGFEHSVANLYFFPTALFVKAFAAEGFWMALARTPDTYGALTWGTALGNLLPVTIGNVIGGAVLVAGVYWFVYLRRR